MSSIAWSAGRTFPNQAVLGDAAGVLAGKAVLNGYQPRLISGAQVAEVQQELKNRDAKLEK